MRTPALLLCLRAAGAQLFPDPVPGQENAAECLTGKIVEADPLCDDDPRAEAALPPMPSGGRAGLAAVTIGSTLIAVGGVDNDVHGMFIRGGVHEVEALNLNTREWSNLPPLQTARTELSAVAVGCIVVVVGGLTAGGRPAEPNILGLDLSKDRFPWQDPDPWFVLPDMPGGPRTAVAAAAVENTVVVMGGTNMTTGNAVAAVEGLDMVTRQWFSLPPMPGGPRRDFAAASIGNLIVALGGMATVNGQDNTGLARVEKLDMLTRTWTTLPPLPGGARYKLAAAAVHHSVVAVGGRRTGICAGKGCTLASVEELDLQTNKWTVRPDRDAGVGSGLAAAAVGGTVVALGGAAGEDSSLSTVEAFCFTPPEERHVHKDDSAWVWELVCVLVTVGVFLGAIPLTKRQTSELYNLPDCQLEPGMDSAGWLALSLFVAATFDILSDAGLVITLLAIGEWLHLICCLVASAVVVSSILQLDSTLFDQIAKSSAGGANVVQQGIKLVAVAVSTARFESLEILRLRLWGKGVISLPMEHKHFAFIQRVSRVDDSFGPARQRSSSAACVAGLAPVQPRIVHARTGRDRGVPRGRPRGDGPRRCQHVLHRLLAGLLGRLDAVRRQAPSPTCDVV